MLSEHEYGINSLPERYNFTYNMQCLNIFQSSTITVMEDRGITCEAEDCAFSTPDMGAEWYPAMVTHLQVYEDG